MKISVPRVIFPLLNPKRGCEFRGLSILEITGREWLKLAPE